MRDGTTINEIFNNLPPINVEALEEELQSKVIGTPQYELNNGVISIDFYTQYKDPTNHLSVNTTLGRVGITMKIIDDRLLTKAVSTTSKEDKYIANRIAKNNWESLNESNIVVEETRQVMFSDFTDNVHRIQFLLDFTEISSSQLFVDQEITNVKFKYDETLDVPDDLRDKTEKDLTIYFNGKNLEGLNEISDDRIKSIVLLEEMIVVYKFDWGNISGKYSVKYSFSGALKSSVREGKFQSEPRLYNTYQIKNISNKRNLEKVLLEEVERLKIEKLKKFELL